MKNNYKLFKFIVLIFSLSLYGCSGVNFSQWHFPYMMEVQQGNYITNKELDQIKIGMTKEQITMIIGYPINQFMFNQSHWEFIYSNYKNNKKLNEYVIKIYFNKYDKINLITKTGSTFKI